MLSNKNRFHGHGSLRYVYKNGEAVRGKMITLKYCANPRRKEPRIAVVISKKVLKRAVGRNRIRRRVYEIIRHELPDTLPKHDMVFLIFSSEILTMPHLELVATIKQLIASARIYKNQE